MTKKDYVKLAAALAIHTRAFEHESALWRQVIMAIADVCAADNPRFDRQRFLTACGVGDDRG